MGGAVEPRVRIFACERGVRHIETIRATIGALDVAVIVQAHQSDQPPKSDKVIAIWDGDHTPTSPNFFREVGHWDKKPETELFLCRMSGHQIVNYPLDIFSAIYDFDGKISLRNWIMQQVLKIEEDVDQDLSISSSEEALEYYRSELVDHLNENRHHSGLHAVQEKPVVETYIPLTLYSSEGKEFVASNSGFHEVVGRGHRSFVLGLPGAGKSTVCSLIAYFAAQERSLAGQSYFPVLLRAKDILELGYDSLIASIRIMVKRAVRKKGKLVSDLILSGDELPDAQTIVFVDGLDELNEDERSRLRQQLNTFEIEYPEASIIVSARPNAHDSAKWDEYDLLRIRSLSLEEAISYVEQHGVEENAHSLKELIKSSEQIRELSSVPFMLTLMANFAGEAEEFPRHRAHLISKCIIALIGRRRKRPGDRFDDESLIMCLAYISNRLFRIDATGKHSEDEFILAVHAFLSEHSRASSVSRQPGEEADVALNEIISGTALLQRVGGNIEFVHRTVWEFFVAHFIVSKLSYDVASVSNQVVWEEPIRIASGLMPEQKVGEFCDPIWQTNPGLALRALSENPYDIVEYVAKGLEKISKSQIKDIVSDLRENLIATEGRFGAERIALDTLKMLLPLSRDAQVYWQSIEVLSCISERVLEAREILVSMLSLDTVEERFLKLCEDLQFVRVPAGNFLMGSTKEKGAVDQVPQHDVKISAFDICNVNLRNRDVIGSPVDIGESDPSRSPTSDHPVVRVTWYEAQIVAIWFGCRLPTEAEWEYCCRSGDLDDHVLFQEDNVSDYAWHSGNSANQTHVGGQKRANLWGLYDMMGNVREWCSDWFQENIYLERAGQNTVDPIGPSSGKTKVLRGGCFDYNTANLYPSNRHSHLPGTRGFQNGVRLVRGLPSEILSILESSNAKSEK